MLHSLKKAKTFPDKPGVYLIKEKSGKIIYIGKAKSLKKRISSYFQAAVGSKAFLIISHANDMECIITSNELEALLLESNLIKKHRPRYNVILRDDKQYPYIKITINEDWPRILVVRKIENDGAAYFGPFRGQTVRDMLKIFKRSLQLRWCKIFKKRNEPCFYYHLKKCLGPCVGRVSKEEYLKVVNEAIDFLDGKLDGVINKLKVEMEKASQIQEYERAASIRNKIKTFERMLESQQVLTPKKEDKDVVAFTMMGKKAIYLVLKIRGGKLIGKESYFIRDSKGETEEFLHKSTLIQYYSSVTQIPQEIIIRPDLAGTNTLQESLSRISGKTIKVICPRRGSDLKLYEMARINANYLLEQNLKLEGGIVELLYELKKYLDLAVIPERIEAFDVSTIMGQETVGSMVVFNEGEPLKDDYRKFKIRSKQRSDDVSAIEEIVHRRYTGMLTRELPLPDLILVDGGRPQVSAAKKAVSLSVAQHIPIMGLAKKLEEIYMPGRKHPLILSRRSSALKLLQRIRNEAHRFAITYHRIMRNKAMLGKR